MTTIRVIDRSRFSRTMVPFVAVGTAATALTLLADDWIAGLAVVLLAAVWRFLRTPAEPPVLALAVGTQWLQVTSAIFYEALTGRRISAMESTDYRPMALIGLTCIVVLASGLRTGLVWQRRRSVVAPRNVREAFALPTLLPFYVASFPLLIILRELAWDVAAFTQPILALSTLRSVLLFLVLRQLVFPTVRSGWLILVLSVEIAFGFSGYFAGFREPLFFAALAFLEHFDGRRARHWIGVAAVGLLVILSSLLWTGIKGDYREQYANLGASAVTKVGVVVDLASDWFRAGSDVLLEDTDRLVDRMWPMVYPAQAVNDAMASGRPPLGGRILWGAIMHVLTPRFLFPDKDELLSDSDMVREFAGAQVAGRESDTSIAFGYAPELFLDLGIPLMFVPVFLYGCLMGAAYAWLCRAIQHRDLAVATVSVIFWLSLYLFERSLVKTFGNTGTLLIYVGASMVLLDWYLRRRRPVAP